MDKEEMLQWINGAGYEKLLTRWRFSSPGDPILNGEVGEHYFEKMYAEKNKLNSQEAAKISKSVGYRV